MTVMFVFARSARSKRPLCQHILTNTSQSETLCGLDLSKCSRSYTTTKCGVLLCRTCEKIAGLEAD